MHLNRQRVHPRALCCAQTYVCLWGPSGKLSCDCTFLSKCELQVDVWTLCDCDACEVMRLGCVFFSSLSPKVLRTSLWPFVSHPKGDKTAVPNTFLTSLHIKIYCHSCCITCTCQLRLKWGNDCGSLNGSVKMCCHCIGTCQVGNGSPVPSTDTWPPVSTWLNWDLGNLGALCCFPLNILQWYLWPRGLCCCDWGSGFVLSHLMLIISQSQIKPKLVFAL